MCYWVTCASTKPRKAKFARSYQIRASRFSSRKSKSSYTCTNRPIARQSNSKVRRVRRHGRTILHVLCRSSSIWRLDSERALVRADELAVHAVHTVRGGTHTFLCILEGSDWLSSSITLICHWRQAVGYAIPQIMILLKHRIGLQPRILERQS